MLDYISIIQNYFSLDEKVNPEFQHIKLSPMTMDCVCFYAKGLGHVSLMKGKALGGLMTMDTLVINSFEKDLPLFSLDRIEAMGKQTLLLELYETRLNPTDLKDVFSQIVSKYQGLNDGKTDPRWYDEIRLPESLHKIGTKKEKASFDALSEEYLNLFLSLAQKASACDKNIKMAEAKKYSEGLLSNGGASTDVFIQKKGQDFTERFFKDYMFGV